jgi:short-subunit dehydrogenase
MLLGGYRARLSRSAKHREELMEHSPSRKSAVVTGASAGIGAAFARKLARQDFDLLLVARRAERLQQLSAELTASHHVRVDVCVADLAQAAAVERVADLVAAQPDLELLINNAGFGTMGHFAASELGLQMDMLRVHVLAPARLTRAALPGMIRRGRGGIVNVSSIGAWLPCAGNVQYAATKSYLNTFSEGLQDELRGTGVRVQALCPGFTYTEFHDLEHMRGFDRAQVAKPLWMSADDVVEYSLRALRRNRVIAIPGWHNRLLARVLRTAWLRPLIRKVARFKERR